MKVPSRHGAASALLLLSAGLLVFHASYFRINAPDFGWHLANGRVMVEKGAIHFADPFSFTTEGRSYPPTQWGFELAIYFIYESFGTAGVIAFKALIVAVLFLVLGRLVLRERSGIFGAAFLLMLALVLARFRFIIRPDLVTYLGVAVVLSILLDFRRGRSNCLRFLPWLFLLWVQFHAGALFGLLVLGSVWLMEELFARLKPELGSLDGRGRNRLLLWTALSAAATLINPNHFRYATYAVGHVEDYAKFAIAELRPLSWDRERALVLYVVAAFLFAAASIRRDPALLPAVVAVGIATIRTVRLFPVFLVLTLPMIAGALYSGRPSAARLRSLLYGLLAIGLAGLVLGAWGSWGGGDLYRPGAGVNDRVLPVAGADALERIDPEGNLFNSNIYGGYLIWRFGGERKVFTDGRSQLHEPTLSYIRTHSWEEIIERYQIGHCLIAHRWMNPRLPGDEMALVWWDDLSLLFVTREEAERRNLPRYSIRYPVAKLSSILAAERAVVVAELGRAVDEAPRSVLPRFLLASVLGASGEWDKAGALFREARRIAPWRGDLAVDHGIALAHTGETEEAVRLLKRGLKIEKENARGWGWLGNLLHRQNDGRGAEKAFRRAIELEPGNAAYPLALGRLYEREGEKERAAALYLELADRFPANGEVQKRIGELAP